MYLKLGFTHSKFFITFNMEIVHNNDTIGCNISDKFPYPIPAPCGG